MRDKREDVTREWLRRRQRMVVRLVQRFPLRHGTQCDACQDSQGRLQRRQQSTQS